MNYIVALAVIAPIAIVLAMMAVNHWVKGWKTNVLGTLIMVLGGVQTMDLSFLSPDIVSAVTAGSGIAVLIASRATDRAK